ncbi:MAG: restriction endonuclease [Deltaproteobacteria bacterium]|nr:MAG: restriction endonuclease [Deltaproteobacteria bacterium]HGY11004.1 restriction endonuclease [Desulfobacterales bacterium]
MLKTEFLIKKGEFSRSKEFESVLAEIYEAIHSITWPENSKKFTLYPVKKASGVVPIKKNFVKFLEENGWKGEYRMKIASRLRPGPIDSVKFLPGNRYFAVEWETGNISSSHRAINKMAIGLLDGVIEGGVLILPSREMYQYLTDRVGNFAEIEPYFNVWKNLKISNGLLAVIEIEHDDLSEDVPPIRKGTDGRALK